MLIKISLSKYQDFLVLSTDKIPGKTISNIKDKVKHFAPKKAKSYTIWNVKSDYYNFNMPCVRFYVSYFTTIKEGKVKL